MAKKTELYRASIIENEELKEIQVDIFDLPYGKFHDETPLIIHGDVSLGRAKGRKIPNMHNVVILGALNLGEFKITSDTVLPDEVAELICEHSINSLDDLPKKLPAKLKQIRIRHALFNNIKKDKDGALTAARRFVCQHRRIKVTDGSVYLRYLLRDIEREIIKNKSGQPIQKIAPATESVVLNKKTDEYCSTDDLLVVCRASVPEFKNLSDSELSRYIKQARSSRANLKIEPVELMREDGVKVVCVHRDYVDTIINFILMQIDANKERETRVKKRKTKTDLSEPVQQPLVSAERMYELDGRKFRTVEIKKYIPKREWNEIKSDRKGNKKELLEILREINMINVNPTDTDGSRVYYVEDGQIKASRMLELKNSRCLAQGFGNLNSRQRIVWGISGNNFVCVDFFAEHEHALHKYKNVIRNMDLDLSKINLSEYYNVTDLIDELSVGRDGPSGPGGASCSELPVDVSVHAAESVPDSTTEQPSVADSVSDTKIVNTAPDIKQVTENKTHDCPNVGANPTGIVWAELYSMNINLTQQISMIDAERKCILDKMQVETNTDKLMCMIREVTHNIQRRKRLEEGIFKLHEMNKKLLLFQSELEKQK